MSWKEFFQALKLEAARDNLTDWAGAVTYAGVMALFPLLLFLVALASLVITTEQAEQLVQQLGAVAPGDVTRIVGERIKAIASEPKGGLLTFRICGDGGTVWADERRAPAEPFLVAASSHPLWSAQA